ncbi:hypothetical protein EAE96_010567 [Botrytis aclada]|nr:hypothetical protein EAE96_010567 [Botrytis aclada]
MQEGELIAILVSEWRLMRRLTARSSVMMGYCGVKYVVEKEKLSRKKRGATGYTGKHEVGNFAPLSKAQWIEM